MASTRDRAPSSERLIVAALGAMTLVVAVIGVRAALDAAEYEADAGRLERAHAVLRDSETVLHRIESMRSAYRGVLLLGDERERRAYASARDAARAALSRLEATELLEGPARDGVVALRADFARAAEAADGLIAGAAASRGPPAAARVRAVDDRLARAARDALDLETAERRVLSRIDEAGDGRARRARAMLVASLLCALAVAASACWLSRRLSAARDEHERSLVAERGRLESILERVEAAVAIKDAGGRYLYANEACARLHGRPRGELLGLRDGDLMPEESAARVADGDRRARETDRSEVAEEVVSASRGARTLLVHRVPLRGTDGRPQLCSIAFDISDRKEHERRVEALNAELDAFAAAISHDLRAPLRAVDGYARMLEFDFGAELPVEAHRLLSLVRAGAARMARLIGDMLAYARLDEAGLAREPLDMRALASLAAREACASEPDRRVKVELGELPAAHGDAAMLGQVWRNLLSNAVKFTRRAADARVEIRGRVAGDFIEYAVRDNGAGFDPSRADRLFRASSRLHTARDYEGNGFGLALVRRVVERHGGTVRAGCPSGGGAEFSFTLPRSAS